jgi:VWFA-related protein
LDLTNPNNVATYCENLARGRAHATALQAVCEFALSLRWKLPNVIGEEERNRYQEGQLGGEEEKKTITAKVRYEDGQEQFTEVKVDGKPVQSPSEDSSGLWSEGEFAADLRGIFSPQSATEFRFTKEETFRSARVLIFDFRVEKKNNRVWRIAVKDKSAFPGFGGRLWISKSDFHLMRLERKVEEIEADFPMQKISTAIDYGDITLADGTNFVLPVRAVNLNCPTPATTSHCWHDRLTFQHWQKFTARARILTAEEGSPATPGSSQVAVAPAIPAPPDLEFYSVGIDVRRGASVLSEILNQQIAEIDEKEKQARAGPAPVDPRKAAMDTQPLGQSAAATNKPKNLPEDHLPVFKSSVRLVQVPTVVRNSRGHTVDTLQKTSFRLFDERRPQLITQFSVERTGGLHGASPESVSEGRQQIPSRYMAYVFDDIHASLDDLIHARDAARRHLTSLQATDRAAIVTLSGKTILDFTNDRAMLSDALSRLQPHALNPRGSVQCPNISYAQADLIQNKNDAMALDQATEEALRCAYAGDKSKDARGPARRLAQTTAAQVLLTGRAESQTAFNILKDVLRGISKAPGQRSVVLVSPGFPIAEMQQQAAEIIDDALRAQVIINVLDPSGLSTADSIEYGSASTPSDILADL